MLRSKEMTSRIPALTVVAWRQEEALLQNYLGTSLLSSSKQWRWQWTRCFWHGAISGGESSNSAQTFAQKYYTTTRTIRYCSSASAISFLAIIHHGKPTFTLDLAHNPDNQMSWRSSQFDLKLVERHAVSICCSQRGTSVFGFHALFYTSFFPLFILIFFHPLIHSIRAFLRTAHCLTQR